MKEDDGIKAVEPVEAFHKFERAIQHILKVPKEKIAEKKNGHRTKPESCRAT
jgi:hypothetical protein